MMKISVCIGGGVCAPAQRVQLPPLSLQIINLNSKRSRHSIKLQASRDKEFEEFRDTEKDVRYQRIDMSEEHAASSRAAFLSAIANGEGFMDLAESSLQIAAEDDALVSHSAVQLPVASFRTRLQRLADELARVQLPPLQESGATDEEILEQILDYLYNEQKFTPPSFGRSNISLTSIVENPGVWENARYAYLNDVLVTRRGIPAALAIILSDVLRRLLAAGAINFIAKVEFTKDMSKAPTATVAIRGLNSNNNNNDSSILNSCTSEALVESLQYLKRAYWPFPWEAARGVGGGFRSAARAFLDGGADSAEAEAIARTARHRLERGIWTSPGGGDLRRAIAAAERLVILKGDEAPEERRDLGVLYCHAGWLKEAKAELKASATIQASQRGISKRPVMISVNPTSGISVANFPDGLPDAVLEDRMLTMLAQIPSTKGKAMAPLSMEEALRRTNAQSSSDKRVLPLTW